MSILVRNAGSTGDAHLGDRASALVDGAMSPREHERLLAHVATCPACRAVVDGERKAKALVSRLSQPEMGVALTAILLTLSSPASSPTQSSLPSLPVLAPPNTPAPLRVGSLSPATARTGRSSVRSFAALSGVGATAAAVLLVGAATAPAAGVAGASAIVAPLASAVSQAPEFIPHVAAVPAAVGQHPIVRLPRQVPVATPDAAQPSAVAATNRSVATGVPMALQSAAATASKPVGALASVGPPWVTPAVLTAVPGVTR